MVKRIPLDNVCAKKIPTLSSQYDGLIDYVDISSVDNTEKKIISYQTIESNDAPSRAKQLLKKGDVLVSTVRPNLNAVAVVEEETENLMVGSTGYCVLRCKDNMDVRYLFNFCQSQYFVDDMSSQATGASYPAVSNGIVRSALIPCYSIEEQREIAEKMDTVSELLALRKQQLAELDELIKSRFIELFGDPRINPKGYDIVPISSLFDVGSSKRVFESEWREVGVPFYRAREIVKLSRDGHVDNELFIEESMYEAYKEKYGVPKAGDMMVTGVGTLGVCYIVKETDRFYFKDGNTLWFKNKGLCDVRFIKDQYDTDFVKEQITANANVSTVGTYTITNANNTLVLIPPLEEQEQYVEFCKQTDKSKLAIQRSLDELETLKKALMQKYFG